MIKIFRLPSSKIKNVFIVIMKFKIKFTIFLILVNAYDVMLVMSCFNLKTLKSLKIINAWVAIKNFKILKRFLNLCHKNKILKIQNLTKRKKNLIINTVKKKIINTLKILVKMNRLIMFQNKIRIKKIQRIINKNYLMNPKINLKLYFQNKNKA